MNSQDVIELDSSEDESEKSRAPKAAAKKPQKRPFLNAMVHIPTGKGSSLLPKFGIPKTTNITGSTKIGAVTVKSNKNLGIINRPNLPNVTIKQLRRVSSIPTIIPFRPSVVRNPISKNAKGSTSGAVKINKTPLHVSNKVLNSKSPGLLKVGPGSFNIQGQLSIPSLSNIMQRMDPQVKKVLESKMTPQQKLALQQKQTPHKSSFKLPPGITVKNVTKNSTHSGQLKRPATVTKSIAILKKIRREMPQPVTVETVELDADDDDDGQPETSSRSVQWYVRPEEIIKKQNENEPEPQTVFEITIEDSPIKPIQNKRTHEVENEISISIEDSPVKLPDENNRDDQADGSSDQEPPKTPYTPSSRKKLKYPNETEPEGVDEKTIEIEIEPYCCNPLADNVAERQEENQNHLIIEIQESPVRKKRKRSPDVTPKKSRSAIADKQDIAVKQAITDKAAVKVDEKITLLNDDDYKDFHPVYKSFIELCFKLDDTEDMKKIVDRKIKSYYLQVPKDYTESEEFVELVSGKMDLIKAGPDNMFLYIKDVVDELNIQRKLARMPNCGKKRGEKKGVTVPPIEFEDSEEDVKRRRQIKKLENTLKKLHRAINKLEEQEVDFDDDGDSVYILTERYKERLIRVHAKLCQLSNVKMPSEPRVSIEARPGQPAGPAKRLEKWINRRVPMGTPIPFPDFHDVLRCVKEANKDDNLGWNDVDVMEEARDLFTRCGKKLQRRRQENEWRVAASRLTADADPAELSADLKRKLDDNRRVALSKETDLINKYADRQKQLKLEAVEISDQEAEESPVESEDEAHGAGDEDANLENSQRLLKKKNGDTEKKDVEDNEKRHDAQEADIELSDLPIKFSSPKDLKVTEIESDKNHETTTIISKESNVKDNCKEMEVDLIEKKDKMNKDISNTIKNASEDDKHKIVKTKDRKQSVETLSDDDSEKVDSDIDELHLLQELHSDEVNSLDSSDSGSLIAISDGIVSGDDQGKMNYGDVVSIENSSSESEQDIQVDGKEKVKETQDKPTTGEKEERMTHESDFNDKKADTDQPIKKRKYFENSIFGPLLLGSCSDNSTESVNQYVTEKDLIDDSSSNSENLVEESNESTDEEVKSRGKSDEINSKERNEVEKSSVICQSNRKINNSEASKEKEFGRKENGAQLPIDCDSVSNEAKINDKTEFSEAVMITFENDESNANEALVQETSKPTNEKEGKEDGISKIDEVNNKDLNDRKTCSNMCPTEKECYTPKECKINKSNQPEICPNSPINCDSESNEAQSNDKIESSETVTISFETDKTTVHDKVKNDVAMDKDIASKEIEVENPNNEINVEVGSKERTSNEDHSNNTDVQVTSENIEVDVNSKSKEDEIGNKNAPK